MIFKILIISMFVCVVAMLANEIRHYVDIFKEIRNEQKRLH